MISGIDIDQEVGSCVFQLFYGNRYVIVKGKSLASSIFFIEKGYAYFVAGGVDGEGHKDGDGKNWFYNKFYSYVRDNPGLQWNIVVVVESENGYDLLKAEHILISKKIKDKRCLNVNVQAYIPKYRKSTRSHGWISRGSVLNFYKYLKSN